MSVDVFAGFEIARIKDKCLWAAGEKRLVIAERAAFLRLNELQKNFQHVLSDRVWINTGRVLYPRQPRFGRSSVPGLLKFLPDWKSAGNQFPIQLVSATKTHSANGSRCLTGTEFVDDDAQVMFTSWTSVRSITSHISTCTNILFQ